jgi:hypothetical protein
MGLLSKGRLLALPANTRLMIICPIYTSLIFAGNAKAYVSGALIGFHHKDRLLTLPANIRLMFICHIYTSLIFAGNARAYICGPPYRIPL